MGSINGSALIRHRLRIVVVGCGSFLAACTAGPEPSNNADLACETVKCVCAKTDTSFLEKRQTTSVLWHDDGSAYCPAGYTLDRAKDGDTFVEQHGG